MRQPLPRVWVERLFARFSARYGVGWTRMWEGVDPEAVMADWSEELGGFQTRPEALKYALEYMPVDKPPTVQQFRALCNRAPEPAPPPQLAPPKASATVVAKVHEILKTANRSPTAWAERLRAREVALEHLTPFQRAAWRDASREASSQVMSVGEFTPPPREVLPPGMLAGRNSAPAP